jgi:hypothetical protein
MCSARSQGKKNGWDGASVHLSRLLHSTSPTGTTREPPFPSMRATACREVCRRGGGGGVRAVVRFCCP